MKHSVDLSNVFHAVVMAAEVCDGNQQRQLSQKRSELAGRCDVISLSLSLSLAHALSLPPSLPTLPLSLSPSRSLLPAPPCALSLSRSLLFSHRLALSLSPHYATIEAATSLASSARWRRLLRRSGQCAPSTQLLGAMRDPEPFERQRSAPQGSTISLGGAASSSSRPLAAPVSSRRRKLSLAEHDFGVLELHYRQGENGECTVVLPVPESSMNARLNSEYC